MFHIELMFEERTSAIKHIWLDCSFLEIYPHTCLHYGHFAWKNLESKLCSSEHGILKLMFCFLYFYWITLEYFFLLNEWFFFKKWVLVVLLLFFFFLPEFMYMPRSMRPIYFSIVTFSIFTAELIIYLSDTRVFSFFYCNASINT